MGQNGFSSGEPPSREAPLRGRWFRLVSRGWVGWSEDRPVEPGGTQMSVRRSLGLSVGAWQGSHWAMPWSGPVPGPPPTRFPHPAGAVSHRRLRCHARVPDCGSRPSPNAPHPEAGAWSAPGTEVTCPQIPADRCWLPYRDSFFPDLPDSSSWVLARSRARFLAFSERSAMRWAFCSSRVRLRPDSGSKTIMFSGMK